MLFIKGTKIFAIAKMIKKNKNPAIPEIIILGTDFAIKYLRNMNLNNCWKKEIFIKYISQNI